MLKVTMVTLGKFFEFDLVSDGKVVLRRRK